MMMRMKPYVEYLARALLTLCGRIVEWALLLSLATLALAAAYWLYMSVRP